MGYLFIGIVAAVFLCGGVALVRASDSAADAFMRIEGLSRKVELGEASVRDLTSDDLFSLRDPKAMAGLVPGPVYMPSFSLVCMISDELDRRRALACL